MNQVQSPCRATCKLNDDNFCIGCYRHMSEIANWNRLSDDQKQAIVDDLDERRKAKPYQEQDLDGVQRITSVQYRAYRQ